MDKRIGWLLLLALPAWGADAGATAPVGIRARSAEATAKYDAKDWAGCRAAFEALGAGPDWSRPLEQLYSAACCAARGGDTGGAFGLLARVVDGGDLSTSKWSLQDGDLEPLHADARWPAHEAAVKALQARRPVDVRIKAIVDADQAARKGSMADFIKQDQKKLHAEDRKRREAIEALVTAGAAKTVDDWLAAALVFQHGETVADIARANALAKKAAALAPASCAARHMVAITEDRLLSRQGKLQKYGTQYACPPGTTTCPREKVDPTVTDAQRVALCVPPLDEQDLEMN